MHGWKILSAFERSTQLKVFLSNQCWLWKFSTIFCGTTCVSLNRKNVVRIARLIASWLVSVLSATPTVTKPIVHEAYDDIKMRSLYGKKFWVRESYYGVCMLWESFALRVCIVHNDLYYELNVRYVRFFSTIFYEWKREMKSLNSILWMTDRDECLRIIFIQHFVMNWFRRHKIGLTVSMKC